MKRFVPTICLFALLLAITNHAWAIPAFARKYQLSCQTCHNPAPRLKPFGDEFAGNGFKMPDQDAPRYFIPTGDPELNLLRDLPLAVRLDGFLNFKENTEQKFDFAAPYLVKIMSGGELTNSIAYYFYFYFDERGEVAGVEDAFIMFNDLLGLDLDVYVGQFQVADPLFKGELRLTLSDYEIYRLKPGLSGTNLAYDKGIMATLGLETGTSFVVSVVNGNGLTRADRNRVFDYDKYKNFSGRVSQDIGEKLRLGAFAYYGKEAPAVLSGPVNNIIYFGPDMTLSFGEKLEFNLQYLFRSDSDLQISEETPAVQFTKTQGGFAEVIYMPLGIESKWYFAGLLNYIESDLNEFDYRSATIHAGYLVKRNIRLAAEYTLLEKETGSLKNQFSLGFSTAF
jgi:hypothetical protein